MRVRFSVLAGSVAFIVINAQALAGVVITGQSTQAGSSQAQVQVVMIQGHRERIESGSQVTIVDADRGTIVVLNAVTKTYTESVMKPAAPITNTHYSSAPRFQPTGARQTIAGYSCQVFKASATTSQGHQTVTGCFSRTVPGWRQYRELNALLARRTGSDSASLELPPGLPLSVVTSLKVRYQLSPKIAPAHRAEMERILASKPPLVSQDLVSGIKTVALSPSLFAAPSDYTKLRVAGPVEH